MLRNRAYNLQFTSTREQVIFMNQIFINLHSYDEIGCISKEKNSLLIDSVYYKADFILQNIDNSSVKPTVFIEPKLTLDVVFSLYMIDQLLQKGTFPEGSVYHSLKYIIESAAKPSHYINFQSILLVLKKLNDEETTIQKMFSILNSLNFAQGINIKQEMLCMHLKFDVLTYLKEEMIYIKKDYQLYVSELKNNSITQTEMFLVLRSNGELMSVPGLVYQRKILCELLDYWLEQDGYGLFMSIETATHGSNVCVKRIKEDIDFQNLCAALNFFEFYLTQGQSNQEWHETDQIVCKQTELTKDQIMSILKHYTDPWVSEQKVKYVFPFHFDYTKSKEIANYLNRTFVSIDESEVHKKFRNTFLPLFNDYLFNNEELSKKQTHSKQFVLQKNVYITVEGKQVRYSYENNVNINPLFIRELNIEIRQFHYGVGFLILNASFLPRKNVPLSYVLDVDKHICDKVQDVFGFLLSKNQHIKTTATRKGIAYESIEIQHDTFFKERTENIILKTCSANKQTYISDAHELKQELAEKFLSRGDFVFYGFSRSCGVQFIVDNALLSKKGLNRLTENFLIEKFFIFLFVLQQRDAIRQFSDKLVGSSLSKEKLETNRIRKDFLEFMTQVRLSHISDHNVVTRFYNRWSSIFDSESIFLEVSEKLNALDGYQQSKVSYHFNILSFIVFPIVAMSSLFTMGIFSTKGIEVDLTYVVLANILLIILFFLFSRRK